MTELEQVLAGDSAHAPPADILDLLADEAVHKKIAGVPHSIYEELWHMAYWQQMTLDWVRGIETPVPDHASRGFPTEGEIARESWERLRGRFLFSLHRSVEAAQETEKLGLLIRCPSLPGLPMRIMTVRDQLESLGAHNAYHFGRIVMLRQMQGLWPPPSGGFTW